jgi:hypothetical protein
VLVITWNALTYTLATLDSRLVFTMLKVATIHPCTMKRVYEVLKWSFDALAKGKFPAEDPWGTKFCKTYMPERARNAGHALAKRADGELYRGAFAEFRGDWKYLKEAFCLAENYGMPDFICHRCQARRFAPSLVCGTPTSVGMRNTAALWFPTRNSSIGMLKCHRWC